MPRQHPNTGELPKGGPSRPGRPQYARSKPVPGQLQQQLSQTISNNTSSNKPLRSASTKRDDSGYSGWDTVPGTTTPRTPDPGASEEWQEHEADDGGVGGGGHYEEDYYDNGEEECGYGNLDGLGDEIGYLDNDPEQYRDDDDVENVETGSMRVECAVVCCSGCRCVS